MRVRSLSMTIVVMLCLIPDISFAITICTPSTSAIEVEPGNSVRVASVRINCSVDEVIETNAIDITASFNFASSDAELSIGGKLVKTGIRVDSDTLRFQNVRVPPEGETPPVNVTLRISNLRVDLSDAKDGDQVGIFLSGGNLLINLNYGWVATVVAPCEQTLSPGEAKFDSNGGKGSFSVETRSGCAWSAESNANWLSVTSGAGSGDGKVSFKVSPNTSSDDRTGTIAVEGSEFTVTQSGKPPSSDLIITSLAVPDKARAGESVELTATIKNLGEGAAPAFRAGFYYSLDETFARDPFSGSTCEVEGLDSGAQTACSKAIDVPESLEPGTYYLLAVVDDLRRVDESDEENNVFVGSPIEIKSAAPNVEPPLAITSAATYDTGVAPGLFVALFGSGWSDEVIVADSLPYPLELGGVSVLLDGEPIPLSVVSDQQINAVIPYALSSGAEGEFVVRKDDETSEPMSVPIDRAAPGILTVTQDGAGQGAILNQDYRLADSNNPIAPGGVLQVYCIGLGPVDPPIAAGEAVDPEVTLYRTIARVRMFVGGLEADVAFSGLAPGFAGLYQVNGFAPLDVATGPAVTVQLVVEFDDGETYSSNIATVAIGDAPGE